MAQQFYYWSHECLCRPLFPLSVGAKALQKVGVAEVLVDSMGNAEGETVCKCKCKQYVYTYTIYMCVHVLLNMDIQYHTYMYMYIYACIYTCTCTSHTAVNVHMCIAFNYLQYIMISH